ncbi:hypothetical protein Rs2_04612 [Raphanus sativus]|nr:hypothetical protein Rs2_04612 [Raphanus sativus]
MAKSVGLRTARFSLCRLHALALRSLSGEFCFVGSFLELTARETSGFSGSSSLLLSVAHGWVWRRAPPGTRASDPRLSSLSLLLWCLPMVFGGACGAPVRVGFVSLAVVPMAVHGSS